MTGAWNGVILPVKIMDFDFDYSKRSYLLPKGCKDLIDVMEPESEEGAEIVAATSVTKNSFVVTAVLLELQNGDIEIIVEGRQLRVVGTPRGQAAFELLVEVPSGYVVAKARAIYFDGELRIVVAEEIVDDRQRNYYPQRHREGGVGRGFPRITRIFTTLNGVDDGRQRRGNKHWDFLTTETQRR